MCIYNMYIGTCGAPQGIVSNFFRIWQRFARVGAALPLVHCRPALPRVAEEARSWVSFQQDLIDSAILAAPVIVR
jgi:hypothetical protein